ncbi:MAG: HK97 family phage prohead protease [Deltaproteobacteria bacterium]|nr:HK97 family phage prohead protease [Deltaproteobacteria bacterium]
MRELRCAIEHRADDSGPGRIVGELIEYEVRAQDRPELFREGALSWDGGGIVLNRAHSAQQPVMRFTPVVEGRKVRIDAALPDTAAGRDLATEIREGLFRGLSIEFRAIVERVEKGVRVVERALLLGAGVVPTPAYPTTVQVRSQDFDPTGLL